MTLSNEDLNLIAQIDARLKHYNLIKPIDTTEDEPIETEQRWRVEVQLRAEHRDDVKIVVTLNDGFITESSGKQLAEAIKQYLSTNKF